MSEYVPLLPTADLPKEGGCVVEVEGKQIAVFTVEGKHHAIDNACPHAGGPLGEGFVDGPFVYCPWHDWCFNVTSGEASEFPKVRVDSYPVRVAGDSLEICLTPNAPGGESS